MTDTVTQGTGIRSDSRETRRQLIDAAERLFAERGVDSVTLLDIGREAGQKNRNAPQYHFGNKTNLINAVLDKHTRIIGLRRTQMLDDLMQRDDTTVEELVRIFVVPVAEHVLENTNSLAFLQINSQMMTSPKLAAIARQRVDLMPEVQRMNRLIGRAAPKISRSRARAKVLLIHSMLHHGLASYHGQGPDVSSRVFTEMLCQAITAVLRDD